MGLGDPFERLGKLRCFAIGGGVSVMATALGLDAAEDVGGSAALVFIVAACHLARRHRLTGSHRIKQLHRPFVQGDHWRSWIGRLAQNVQHLLHPLDLFLVQLRHAPHFFPATALARGSQIIGVWSRGRPWRPARGAWLHGPSARWSTANDLPEAGHTPSPRSQPAAWHQAAAPVWAAGRRSARRLTHAPNNASPLVALPADRCPPQPRCPQASSPDPATPKSEFAANSARSLPAGRSAFAAASAAPRSSTLTPETSAATACLLPHFAFDQIPRPSASYPVILTRRSKH